MEITHLPKREIKKDTRFQTANLNPKVAEHVKRFGLLTPLTVWKNGDHHILIDGYSRIDHLNGDLPVTVIQGDFVEAMRVRCLKNMVPQVRSFAELGRIFKVINEEEGELERSARLILPPVGLEPSVELAGILRDVGELNPSLLNVLEKKKSPLRIYQQVLTLPPSLHHLLYQAVEKFNLSLSRVRIACERIREILDREGEDECVRFLKNVVESHNSACLFEYEIEKRARPIYYSALEKIEGIDLKLRKLGPLRLKWDRTFEKDEVYLEVRISFSDRSGLQFISSEEVKELLEKAVNLVRRGEV